MQGTINYTIEQGFILELEQRKGLTELYPFDTMKVDDSFLLGSFNNTVRTSCLNRAKYFSDQEGKDKKFSSRMTVEGYRIWRIK